MSRLSRSLAFLVLSAGAVAPGPRAAAQPQQTPSIVASFRAFWTAARGKSFARQEALWTRYVEGPRETLYRSIVWEVPDNPHWRTGRRQMLQWRFAQYPRLAAAIAPEARAIESQLGIQSKRLREIFPGASAVPRAVILLAPDFDSKSGVLPDGTPVLALAADSLALEKADLRIILPHELFHLYDAEHAGVKNDGVMPDTQLTLPLFAEGLATYVSTVASPGHSDGEYLLQPSLGALPPSRLEGAARDFLRVADIPTIDPQARRMSPQFRRWFESDDEPLNPGYPNRAGYWLGLHLIRRLRRTYTLQQIASWPPAEAELRMRAALAAMAAGRSHRQEDAAK